MKPAEDTTEVAVRVARALERAGIDYAVGGSVASSAHGEPRATRDLDFAVRVTPHDIPGLMTELGRDFVVDAASLAEAVRTGGIVNIFYMPSFTKIDFFIRGDDDYDRAEFARRVKIEPVPGERILASSAEDNLLWKLRRYQSGKEVSDQQWRDVLGLIRISGEKMDLAYLHKWAALHGVLDLLNRARNQGSI